MKWVCEKVKLKDLQKNEKNPRKMSKKEAKNLENSITKFGLCQPIVASRDGKIIGGHQRYEILKHMGRRDVEVFMPEGEFEEKDAEELMLLLNKISGSWDDDILANCWDMDFLVDAGFTHKELGIEPLDEVETEKPSKLAFTFESKNKEFFEELKEVIAKYVDSHAGEINYKIKES